MVLPSARKSVQTQKKESTFSPSSAFDTSNAEGKKPVNHKNKGKKNTLINITYFRKTQVPDYHMFISEYVKQL